MHYALDLELIARMLEALAAGDVEKYNRQSILDQVDLVRLADNSHAEGHTVQRGLDGKWLLLGGASGCGQYSRFIDTPQRHRLAITLNADRDDEDAPHQLEAYARRVVACVNACAKVSTEQLERDSSL